MQDLKYRKFLLKKENHKQPDYQLDYEALNRKYKIIPSLINYDRTTSSNIFIGIK